MKSKENLIDLPQYKNQIQAQDLKKSSGSIKWESFSIR
jgi:hypothetical protein